MRKDIVFSEQLSIRISPEQRARLEAIAREQDRTIGQLIRHELNRVLQQRSEAA
jgi:predicted DNA-binding protein